MFGDFLSLTTVVSLKMIFTILYGSKSCSGFVILNLVQADLKSAIITFGLQIRMSLRCYTPPNNIKL
jgi:hypothetical protein